MSNEPFSAESGDTPWMTPGWTVQSGPNLAGDQSLVKATTPPASAFPVTSVNSKPGPTVTLAATDVGAVNKVNGKSPTAGAITLAASDVGALPNTAVATKQSASGEAALTAASVTGVTGTDAANLAKLSDLQALGALVDSLNTALQNAGLEASH